jgi:hypothetical protein
MISPSILSVQTATAMPEIDSLPANPVYLDQTGPTQLVQCQSRHVRDWRCQNRLDL